MEIKKQNAKDADRIPVSWLLFGEPADFPGVQESNVRCTSEPAPNGRGFVCYLVKSLASFELGVYHSGQLQATRMIPVQRVKQYELA